MEELIDLSGLDKPYEPSLVERRYVRARRYYWKYRDLEKRVAALKVKWSRKLNYYEKRLRSVR